MRAAYSGRAAAYEKMGDLERALLDHNQLILLSGIEAEILTELDSSSREAFLREFAEQYLYRSKCLRGLRRTDRALRDLKRAAQLEDDAEKLATKAAKAKPQTAGKDPAAVTGDKGQGRILLINVWTQPVTVVLDGTTYALEVAEIKSLLRPAGTIGFEVQGSQQKQKALLEAGKTVKIWVGL
jgi:tetratricopeptide (TPR) repeat protein